MVWSVGVYTDVSTVQGIGGFFLLKSLETDRTQVAIFHSHVCSSSAGKFLLSRQWRFCTWNVFVYLPNHVYEAQRSESNKPKK